MTFAMLDNDWILATVSVLIYLKSKCLLKMVSFQTATWEEYLADKEGQVADNVKVPVLTYLNSLGSSPRAVAGLKSAPRNAQSPPEGIQEAMVNRVIDELGSDHHAAVELARHSRAVQEVSQIQLTATPLVPATPSIGGPELRRQLFPPICFCCCKSTCLTNRRFRCGLTKV